MPPKANPSSAPAGTAAPHSAAIANKGPPPSLSSLEATMAGDRLLREQVLSLVEKEKRLAELELLLRIAATSGDGVIIGGHARRSQKLFGKENVESMTSELSKRSSYSATLFDDSDPTRIDASCLAPAPWWPIPPSGCLRPRSERPEITGSEAALLGSSAVLKGVRIGIDLSRMQPPLQDESGAVGYLQTLFSVASGAGASQTLRILNVSVNQLGLAGATALVEAIGTKLPKLEALCVEHNPLGGPPGIGAIIDICTKAPSLCHIGITLSCVDPLVGGHTAPYMLVNIQITPPGLQAEKGKSGKEVKKGSEKKPAGGDKKTVAKGAKSGAATSGPIPGSLNHLSNAIRGGGGSISSISLAGSSLTREGLLSFLAAWAPPEPVPVLTEPAHSSDSAGAAAKGKAAVAPPAAKKGTADKAGAKGGSTAVPQKVGKFVPIQALSLSRTHCGALSALDVSVALGPAPVRGGALDDKLMAYVKKLGGLTPNAEQTSAAAVSAAVAAQAPAAATTAASSKAKSSLHSLTLGSSVHGCLQYIRILNLSSCGLSTHGVIPILESIALHSNYLTHLILRDNFIDDVGALALSTALRMNHSRITTLQQDAMAFSILSDPYYKLTGDYPGRSRNSPPPSLSDKSHVEHHLAVANAAKLNGRHFSPVRIVDITNNPLSLSAEAGSHPGCAALVECLETIESLLTICGPAPSVESQHLFNVAAKLPPQWPGTLTSALDLEATHIVDSLAPNAPLPDEVIAGEGEAYPLDLSSVAYAAHATLVGGGGSSAASAGTVASASQGVLAMPPRLSHGAAQVTISKISRLNAAISEAKKARQNDAPSSSASSVMSALSSSSSSSSDGSSKSTPSLVLSRLRLPVSTTVWLQPLSLSPLSFSLNNTRSLSALSLQEVDCGSNGCATLLGPPVVTLGLSSGISAHSIADVPVSITSSNGTKASWALKPPSAIVEWRAGLVSSIESAWNAGLYSLVFHVFVCGANNTSMQYLHSTTLGEGSRDRSHARMRMVARTKSSDTEKHSLDAIDKVTAADNSSVDWAEGAGLEVPRALGSHNAQSDVNALPATVTVQAAESSGSDLVAWPVSWHCAELPSYLLSSVGEKTIKIFAELVQTSVRGLKNDNIADSSRPLSLHILEAEVVMTSKTEAGAYQGLADIEYRF